MKKVGALALAAVVGFSLAVPFISSAAEEAVVYPGPGVKNEIVFNNDSKITLEAGTFVQGGRTYLPVKELSEKLGLHVYYVAGTNSAYILDSTNHANLASAEKGETMNLFRNAKKLDTKVVLKDGRAFIPADDFAAALNRYYYNDVLSGSHYMFDHTAGLADGNYTAVGLADARGYVPTFEMTVQNGRITKAYFDEYSATGLGKKDDADYQERWAARITDITTKTPAELVAQMEADLVAKQIPANVDVVTGATSAHKSMVKLANKAVAQAKAAEASVAVDFNYRDGNYVIVGLTASNGWTPQVDMVVKGGKIVSVEYTAYNENGASKRLNGDDYLTRWMSRYEGVDPVAIIAEREAQLIKTQDPNLVDTATGATGWGTDLKLLTVGALNQARMADIEVEDGATIYVFHGKPTAASAYYVQLLAVAKDGVIQDVDYVEYQTGEALAKPHNSAYLERWATTRAELLAGRNQLDILQEMLDKFMETKEVSEIDTITGATNWGKGIKDLGPKAVKTIEN